MLEIMGSTLCLSFYFVGGGSLSGSMHLGNSIETELLLWDKRNGLTKFCPSGWALKKAAPANDKSSDFFFFRKLIAAPVAAIAVERYSPVGDFQLCFLDTALSGTCFK